MTQINDAGETARENARTTTGQFGSQEHSAPETQLVVGHGEAAVDKLQELYDREFASYRADVTIATREFPSVVADLTHHADPSITSLQIEFFQREGDESVEPRVGAVYAGGEERTVNWDAALDDLEGTERSDRVIAEHVYETTSQFARYHEDFDIPGITDQRIEPYFDQVHLIDVDRHTTGATPEQARAKHEKMTQALRDLDNMHAGRRRELNEAIPGVIAGLLPEGIDEVGIVWERSLVSEDSDGNDYTPRATLRTFRSAGENTVELTGDAHEGLSRDDYYNESVGAWVNEMLGYGVADEYDLALMGDPAGQSEAGDPVYVVKIPR